MSSKLISIARVVFLSKAAAARSAPAAIVGPLQRIFGSAEHEEENEDEQEQQEHEENGAVLESTSSSVANESSIFSALVVAARAEATNRATSAAAPIDTPFAKRELQDFQKDYYRRAIANAQAEDPDLSEDMDLSIPVGDDDYLYLAQ